MSNWASVRYLKLQYKHQWHTVSWHNSIATCMYLRRKKYGRIWFRACLCFSLLFWSYVMFRYFNFFFCQFHIHIKRRYVNLLKVKFKRIFFNLLKTTVEVNSQVLQFKTYNVYQLIEKIIGKSLNIRISIRQFVIDFLKFDLRNMYPLFHIFSYSSMHLIEHQMQYERKKKKQHTKLLYVLWSFLSSNAHRLCYWIWCMDLSLSLGIYTTHRFHTCKHYILVDSVNLFFFFSSYFNSFFSDIMLYKIYICIYMYLAIVFSPVLFVVRSSVRAPQQFISFIIFPA